MTNIVKFKGRYVEVFEAEDGEYYCSVRDGFGITEFETPNWPTPEDAVSDAQNEITLRQLKTEESAR